MILASTDYSYGSIFSPITIVPTYRNDGISIIEKEIKLVITPSQQRQKSHRIVIDIRVGQLPTSDFSLSMDGIIYFLHLFVNGVESFQLQA